ncbi:hypothetical protein Tco_0683659 [Tanacetum coccineum]
MLEACCLKMLRIRRKLEKKSWNRVRMELYASMAGVGYHVMEKSIEGSFSLIAVKIYLDWDSTISKCCLKEAFTRAPNQHKEYLSEFWYTAKTLDDFKVWISSPIGGVSGEIHITTFRNAFRAQYLPHLSMYVPPPSITTVRPWFATIGYRGEIGAKGTLKKSCLPSRWRLLMAQIMQCLGGKTGGLDQISNKDATILEKIIPYPRFLSLILEHMMLEYENEELTINPTKSESASGHDATVDSTTEADPGISAPKDSIS